MKTIYKYGILFRSSKKAKLKVSGQAENFLWAENKNGLTKGKIRAV